MAERTGRDDASDATWSSRKQDEEDELELAAIEGLQAQGHLGTSVPFDHQQNFTNVCKKDEETGKTRNSDHYKKLGAIERHAFIDRLLKKIEEDNYRLLLNQKKRIDRSILNFDPVSSRHSLQLHAQ